MNEYQKFRRTIIVLIQLRQTRKIKRTQPDKPIYHRFNNRKVIKMKRNSLQQKKLRPI